MLATNKWCSVVFCSHISSHLFAVIFSVPAHGRRKMHIFASSLTTLCDCWNRHNRVYRLLFIWFYSFFSGRLQASLFPLSVSESAFRWIYNSGANGFIYPHMNRFVYRCISFLIFSPLFWMKMAWKRELFNVQFALVRKHYAGIHK